MLWQAISKRSSLFFWRIQWLHIYKKSFQLCNWNILIQHLTTWMLLLVFFLCVFFFGKKADSWNKCMNQYSRNHYHTSFSCLGNTAGSNWFLKTNLTSPSTDEETCLSGLLRRSEYFFSCHVIFMTDFFLFFHTNM